MTTGMGIIGHRWKYKLVEREDGAILRTYIRRRCVHCSAWFEVECQWPPPNWMEGSEFISARGRGPLMPFITGVVTHNSV